ncbi:hypothetical protein PYW07_008391 [Mythimna separata]|uniref:trypsin n=1 Tax=Mythimna separata TaxID=271217 RepID=A0AAD7YCK5_MYTSE|nr:hypothetical protein PYW07_008391 [Mythimna separata]
MISTRVFLLFIVLTSYAYGHKKIKRDQERHDHNVGIIGGHDISIEQAPFMVSIRAYGVVHWCAGSIIHERFILTTAQCAQFNNQYRVLVGSDQLYGGGKLYDVEKNIIHEKYSYETGDYDLGLMKLNESLTFGPTVSKVFLSGHGNRVKVEVGTMLNITGWGFADLENDFSNVLQQATVPVIASDLCVRYYHNFQLTLRMLCTDATEKDPCLGDEGGPLTWNNIQIGIITRRTGCGEYPTVYTHLKTVNRWIRKTINKHHNKKEN